MAAGVHASASEGRASPSLPHNPAFPPKCLLTPNFPISACGVLWSPPWEGSSFLSQSLLRDPLNKHLRQSLLLPVGSRMAPSFLPLHPRMAEHCLHNSEHVEDHLHAHLRSLSAVSHPCDSDKPLGNQGPWPISAGGPGGPWQWLLHLSCSCHAGSLKTL